MMNKLRNLLLSAVLLMTFQTNSFAGFASNFNTGDTTASSTTFVEHVELNSTNGITDGDWLFFFNGGSAVDSASDASVSVAFQKNDSTLSRAIIQEPNFASSAMEIPNQWWYFADEGLSTDTYQVKVAAQTGTNAVRVADGGIVGIDLSGLTQGTDFLIANSEEGTDNTAPTASGFQNIGSSITIPSGNSGNKWLLLGRAHFDIASTGSFGAIRFNIDSGSSTPLDLNVYYGNDGRDEFGSVIMWVYTVPDASTHTVQLQYNVSNSSTDIYSANLFALNLDALSSVVDFAQSESAGTNTTDSFVDYSGASKNINFTDAGNYLLLGYLGAGNSSDNSGGIMGRISWDDTNSYQQRRWIGNNTSELDYWPSFYMDIESIGTPATHDADLKFKHRSTGSTTANVKEGCIVAIFEGASEGGGGGGGTPGTGGGLILFTTD